MEHVSKGHNGTGRGPLRTTLLPQMIEWPTVAVQDRELIHQVSPRSRPTNNDCAMIREHKTELFDAAADPFFAESAPPVSTSSQPKLARPMEFDWLARFQREPVPWNAEDTDLIRWFVSRRDALPCQPFALFGFAKVTDPQKLYAALERDIQAGSNGPRATGLRHELRQLRVLC